MDSLTRVLNGSAASRRAAALALLALVAATAAALVLTAALSAVSSRQAVRDKRVHLGQLQSVLALKPGLEAARRSAQETQERPEFLSGASAAVIQADLQAWLNRIAAAHGVEVMSVGNAPQVEQDGMRFAGLRANLSGASEGIYGTILAIESARPYLIVRQAQLHSTLGSQQAAHAGPAELVLQIQFYGALPPQDWAGATGAVR